MRFWGYHLNRLENTWDDWILIEKRVRVLKYRLFLKTKYFEKSQLKFQQNFGLNNIDLIRFSIKTILNYNKANFLNTSSFNIIFYELAQIEFDSYLPTSGKRNLDLVLDFCCQIRVFHIFEPEWVVKQKFYFFNCQRNTIFFL